MANTTRRVEYRTSSAVLGRASVRGLLGAMCARSSGRFMARRTAASKTYPVGSRGESLVAKDGGEPGLLTSEFGANSPPALALVGELHRCKLFWAQFDVDLSTGHGS